MRLPFHQIEIEFFFIILFQFVNTKSRRLFFFTYQYMFIINLNSTNRAFYRSFLSKWLQFYINLCLHVEKINPLYNYKNLLRWLI